MSKEKIRFKSCFICDVAIDDKQIELVDSTHHSFYIDKNDAELMAMFKDWFVNVYKACIPQTLTIVQYDVVDNDGEPETIVKKLFYTHKHLDEKTGENKNDEVSV